VLAAAVTARYLSLQGETVKQWVQRCLRPDGDIDWTTSVSYQLIWLADRLVSLKHRLSGHETRVPEDLHIDRSFKLENPSSDLKTMLTNKPLRKYPFLDVFDPASYLGSGPHGKFLDKKGRDMVSKVVGTVASKRQELQTGNVVGLSGPQGPLEGAT